MRYKVTLIDLALQQEMRVSHGLLGYRAIWHILCKSYGFQVQWYKQFVSFIDIIMLVCCIIIVLLA